MSTYVSSSSPDVDPYPPRRRRRRGRWVLIGVLVGLIVLLVVADRVAAYAAGSTLAERVGQATTQQGVTSKSTSAEIQGVPFLTQVAAGDYDAVEITMREVGREGITVDELRVTAEGVRLSTSDLVAGQADKATAAKVTADADMSFASLTKALGLPGLTLRKEGEALRVTAPLSVFGSEAKMTGLAQVSLADGKLVVDIQDVELAEGEAPDAILDRAAERLSQTMTLPPPPYGLKLTDLQITDTGVSVTASGTNVSLAG
jgi:LmeA-like phospholipid-binding